MQAIVHSASVSPIFMNEWLPLSQLSSVTTPRNSATSAAVVIVPGAADKAATPSTTANDRLSTRLIPNSEFRILNFRIPLLARNHEMRGRRSRVHDPYAAAAAVLGQPQGRLGRAGDRNR